LSPKKPRVYTQKKQKSSEPKAENRSSRRQTAEAAKRKKGADDLAQLGPALKKKVS
jgi:hypothetical protein